jgi:hypothetical protein
MNTPTKQTCTNATLSLVFGILSWFALPFIGAVIAVVCGHMARAEIRRSQGQLEGDGLAVGGLILGYLHLALALLLVLAIFMFFGGLMAFLAFAAHHGHF